jgi:Rps23 Pro-64 3,4-dihydroxylase Tpa1-like proline 4-hydroxylase
MRNLINDLDLNTLRDEYKKGQPFNYAVIDNFFKEDIAEQLANEFPDYNNDEAWNIYKNPLENKRLTPDWNLFPALTYETFTFLNTPEFIEKIEHIIGVNNVKPDMGLHGGGWHVTPSGGKLNVHLDYSIHPKLKMERRANLIIYLSHWQSEWDGALQLWSHDEETQMPKECVSKVEVKFNRAIIFDTTQNSWHGLPDEIKAPSNVLRKSLNIYYLTEPREGISTRERALFAPYKNQSEDESIKELIKKRASSTTISQAYRTE